MNTKWEYRRELLKINKTTNESRMSYLGKNGWELVAVTDGVMYFKRELEA